MRPLVDSRLVRRRLKHWWINDVFYITYMVTDERLVPNSIERDGFAIASGVLDERTRRDLIRETEGFSSWSMKEGVVHVQPPVQLLEQMLSVRLHLDPTDDTNGALWVSPASHRLGRLPAGEAASVAERNGKHLCVMQAGDALLFRPLVLHASRKARSLKPRRVIHLEFAGASLPKSLAWAEVAS